MPASRTRTRSVVSLQRLFPSRRPIRSCGQPPSRLCSSIRSWPRRTRPWGWVYAFERDWANAEKAFQQSISLNPSLTQTYTSYSISTLQPLRKYDEALRLLNTASQHDPLSLDVQREIGDVQLFSGRYAEAVDTFQRVSEVDPDFPFVQTLPREGADICREGGGGAPAGQPPGASGRSTPMS